MYLAPRGCGFEQDCSQCADLDKRREWGCDEPTAEPVFWLSPCPACAGRTAECAGCDGTNRMPMHRCPNKLATARELDVLRAALLVEQGVLPDPGGWHDQAHSFVEVYPIAQQEIGSWRKKNEEEARRRARAK